MLLQSFFALTVLISSAFAKAQPYSWHETVEGLQVFSVSYDNGGSQHIVLVNTSSPAQASEVLEFEKNTAYQNFENPDNYTIIPYFSYGVNVTEQYVDSTATPVISSFGHYLDQSNNTGDVVDLDGHKTTINLTSTEQTLVVKQPIRLGKFLSTQLIAAATRDLVNNIVFIQYGDLHLRFSFSKVGLSEFSDHQKEIIYNILTQFVLVHEQYGSVPGLILNNFDGDGNEAYITFGHSEDIIANVIVVNEETYASVALN